jgi:hypothetical protein
MLLFTVVNHQPSVHFEEEYNIPKQLIHKKHNVRPLADPCGASCIHNGVRACHCDLSDTGRKPLEVF